MLSVIVSGYIGSDSVSSASGVRPVVSLAPGTTIKSGSGTANDPWRVQNTTEYTITYDANNGSGSIESQTSIPYGSSVTVQDNAFTRTNYYFKGWGTNATTVVYHPGESITITEDTTLYAIWGNSSSASLYDAVASLSKGTFSNDNINDALTTNNSGVYSYNGSHSDNSSANTVYFYRGILDTSFDILYGSTKYGSAGNGMNYPNYVKLVTNNIATCWRIFRTTGSGGVKMIYNGVWTGSTCANYGDSANALSTYWNRGTPNDSSDNYGTNGFATYVGYNYNSTYAYNNTSYTSAISNTTLFNNGTASNIRTQVESWYKSTITTNYSSLFETNAGYCNDRSTYNYDGASQTTSVPYDVLSSNGNTYAIHFGAYIRLLDNASPSLQCPNITGLDLLNGTVGKS